MRKLFLLILFAIPFLLVAQTAEDYNERGIEALDSNDLEQAIFFFNKSIELKEDFDISYFNRGYTYLQRKDYSEALSDFVKSIRLTGNDTIAKYAFTNIAYLKRNKIKDLDGALNAIDRALKIDPHHVRGYHIRGLIMNDLERFEEAIESYSKALEFSPRLSDIYYDRGISYRQLDRLDEAIADYTRSLEIDPTSSKTFNNRGFAKQKKRDFAGAIEDFTEAIEIDDSAYSYNNRGFAKYELGEYESARIDCENSIKLNPENSWAYHYLGLIYYELNRKEEACELFMRAVNMGKEDAMSDYREKCTRP